MPPAGSWAQFQFRSQFLNPRNLSQPLNISLLFTIPIPNRNLESNSNSHSTRRTHVHVIVVATLVAIFGSLTANDVNLDAPSIPEDATLILPPPTPHTKLYLIGAWSVQRERETEKEREGESGFHRAARQQLSPKKTHAHAHVRALSLRNLSVNGYQGVWHRPTQET